MTWTRIKISLLLRPGGGPMARPQASSLFSRLTYLLRGIIPCSSLRGHKHGHLGGICWGLITLGKGGVSYRGGGGCSAQQTPASSSSTQTLLLSAVVAGQAWGTWAGSCRSGGGQGGGPVLPAAHTRPGRAPRAKLRRTIQALCKIVLGHSHAHLLTCRLPVSHYRGDGDGGAE